jgi:NADH-quinone oxidoreductase subunit C
MIPSLEQLSDQFTRLIRLGAVTPNVEDSTAAAPGPTATPPPSPGPVQPVDYSLKGYHLDVTVSPGQVVLAAEILDQNGFGLDAITGVDWIAQNELEVVYDYFHPLSPLRVAVRARVPRGHPELPTLSGVFPGANWHERETHDFFGIRFLGHPDLTPFLLPEDADYHPLRKDFNA